MGDPPQHQARRLSPGDPADLAPPPSDDVGHIEPEEEGDQLDQHFVVHRKLLHLQREVCATQRLRRAGAGLDGDDVGFCCGGDSHGGEGGGGGGATDAWKVRLVANLQECVSLKL